jgi:hypothetical protein
MQDQEKYEEKQDNSENPNLNQAKNAS